MLSRHNFNFLLQLFLFQLLDFHFSFEQSFFLLHLQQDLPEPQFVLSFFVAEGFQVVLLPIILQLVQWAVMETAELTFGRVLLATVELDAAVLRTSWNDSTCPFTQISSLGTFVVLKVFKSLKASFSQSLLNDVAFSNMRRLRVVL